MSNKTPIVNLKAGDLLWDCHRQKAGNTAAKVDGVWRCYVREVGSTDVTRPDGTTATRHWAMISWNGNPARRFYDSVAYTRWPKEWNKHTIGGEPTCALCRGRKSEGHEPDCEHPAAERARKRAEKAAKVAAKALPVVSTNETKRIKPSGWKGKRTDRFWTKDSVYGVRYMCSDCGRDALGSIGGLSMHAMNHHHWSTCPRWADVAKTKD
jgi:hypothetical protein